MTAATETPAGVLAPPVRIRPRRGWRGLGLRDVWAYRELLYFLTWRDIKVRYRQTALGAAWAVIQPLFTMLVLSLFFGRLAKVPSDGIPYPIFAFVALLPWTFFAGSLDRAGNSLVGSANLITKVYFPRLIIPISAVLAGLLDLAVAFVLLLVLMSHYGIAPTPALLAVPALVLAAGLLALGVGLWLSALNVEYRDIRYTLPFLTQVWFFASPVAYPVSLVPEPWRAAYGLNPMVGLIEGFRWALLGKAPPSAAMLAVSAGVLLSLLVSGAFYFQRMERSFADVV